MFHVGKLRRIMFHVVMYPVHRTQANHVHSSTQIHKNHVSRSYTVKKVNDFPRDSLVSDIPAGDGKIDILFLQCSTHTQQNTKPMQANHVPRGIKQSRTQNKTQVNHVPRSNTVYTTEHKTQANHACSTW
jgi:hypothetical protein